MYKTKFEGCLKRVQKPARYIGNEFNSIHKEKTGEQRLFRPVYSVHYCEEFFGGVCDGFCPRGFQHDRYWKQHDELKVVQNALAEFWDKKFQNVK